MTLLDILGVWNLFMTRQFIPVYTVVYTAPCLKLPALPIWVLTDWECFRTHGKLPKSFSRGYKFDDDLSMLAQFLHRWWPVICDKVLPVANHSTYSISQEICTRNMHMVFALLCFVVVIHWLIFPYPSGLLHWHCGNLTIAPVPAKQSWWKWINTSCEFIMNDCITTTKQSTTKPCAYFLGYTV